jgi:MFS family permease
VLLCSQAFGGVGLVATYIVTALLAKDISGSKSLATVAAALLSVGSAVVAFPLARLSSSRGRRVGLRTGYLIGAVGAGIALLAAVTRSYPLLCVGVLGAGAGNAANLATRYAAADMASDERRARTISLIVWATVVGSSAGSAISATASDVGESIGLPIKGGSYLLSGLMFVAAATIVELKLRPDPLTVAAAVGTNPTRTEAARPRALESLALIWGNPATRLAMAAMVVSQITMVGVMSLTPLHMDEGHHSQGVIGLMMVFHIWGMYLFSPVVGRLTDRFGPYPMLSVAGALCTGGAAWAAVTPASGVLGVFTGNFLIGLGWCFGIIAGSSLLIAPFSVEQRLGVQGVGDLAMIGSGAIAGISSGLLYSLSGYGGVNFGNAAFGALLVAATACTVVVVRRRAVVAVTTHLGANSAGHSSRR